MLLAETIGRKYRPKSWFSSGSLCAGQETSCTANKLHPAIRQSESNPAVCEGDSSPEESANRSHDLSLFKRCLKDLPVWGQLWSPMNPMKASAWELQPVDQAVAIGWV